MKSENLLTISVNFLKSKWHSIIALLSLIAITVYLILSALNTTFTNVPLLCLIVIGGVPLFLQIILKLLRGNFGADSLAGINDAPALTAATVGIAFGQHSNVTAAAAGAVIMENTLCKVDELLHLSINTRNIAAQSAIGGMILSIIGMGFAAAGFISPVMGAIIQECIDILAIVNALRLAFGSKIKIDLPNN